MGLPSFLPVARRRNERALDHRRVTRRHRDVLYSVGDAALIHDLAVCGLEIRDAQICRGEFADGHKCALGDVDDDSAIVVGCFLQLLVCVLIIFTCVLLVEISFVIVGTVKCIHTLEEIAKGESAFRPLTIDKTTRGMEPRLPFLRRGGVCDALLAHVSNVRGSSVQTALDLDIRKDVEVE